MFFQKDLIILLNVETAERRYLLLDKVTLIGVPFGCKEDSIYMSLFIDRITH